MENGNYGIQDNIVQAPADKNGLNFNFLPAFASWILNNKLDEFVQLQLKLSAEEKIPLLQHFSHFSEAELFAISTQSARELLEPLAENKAREFVDESIEKWLNNQLILVDKHHIVAEDIALVSSIRRAGFRTLLAEFTQDMDVFRQVMTEVDQFTTFSDIAAFNTLFKIQQEKKQEVDQLLEVQRNDLLEAQELARMGSFYWDLVNREGSHFTPNTLRIFELDATNGLDNFLLNVHPDDRTKLARSIEESFINGGMYECEYIYIGSKKPKKIWSRGIVHFDKERPVAIKGTVMDVTYQSHLLEELQRNEQLFNNAEALTHLGHWSWDIPTNTIVWSDEMYRIYGLEPQSEKITFERFMSLVHNDYRENRKKEIQKALDTGEADDYLLKIVTPAGEEKMLRGKGQLAKDSQGKPIRFDGTCQDVTKEYQIQNELKNKSLLLEEKNNELERINQELESFNYAASHDMQEPLRKIQLLSSRIIEDKNLDPGEITVLLEKINASASRMQNLIKNLLLFSQTTGSEDAMEVTNLNNILTETKQLLAHMIEETGTQLLHDELPTLMVVPFQMQQVFTNLINNAVKYRREDVIPRISITCSLNDGAEVGISGNQFAKITIADNGTGFDPVYAEKIFSLFSRLHPAQQYSGTGIGLAICKKIIQNHQGFIKAESDGRTGARFHIYLPKARIVQ